MSLNGSCLEFRRQEYGFRIKDSTAAKHSSKETLIPPPLNYLLNLKRSQIASPSASPVQAEESSMKKEGT